MVDRERVLAKIDELNGYLGELRQVAPATLEDYRRIETKRACERLLQIAVECVIDICQVLASGLRLGLPGGEDDLLERLHSAGVFSAQRLSSLRRMKGCRNILVHGYGRVNDEIVFHTVRDDLADFDGFVAATMDVLASRAPR